MSATDPVFAIGALAISLLTAWFVARLSPCPPEAAGSLDGLRGLLAMLVMIAHASAWRLYAVTGEWTVPPSSLCAHFAKSSVVLFFMITAFLFGSKLLESRERPSTGFDCMFRERSGSCRSIFHLSPPWLSSRSSRRGWRFVSPSPGSASRSPTGSHSRSATCPL